MFKLTKEVLLITLRTSLYAFIIIWLAFAGFALHSVPPPPTCPKPYQAWALTWPIWKVAPSDWLHAFLLWSVSLCPQTPSPMAQRNL